MHATWTGYALKRSHRQSNKTIMPGMRNHH